MADIRAERLAKLLIDYSLQIKAGDRLVIYGPAVTEQLIEAAYREAVKAGAVVKTVIALPNLSYHLYDLASDKQLDYLWETDKQMVEEADAMLYFQGATNTRSLSGADPAKVARAQKTGGPIFKRRMERSAKGELRWAISLFPTEAGAQEANMSTRDFEDFAYAACRCDLEDPASEWRKMNDELVRIGAWLQKRKEFRVVAEDTDLTFTTGNREWEVDAGRHNMPDGEVCTAPLEDSAEGHIRFSFPAIYNGHIVENVFLRFEKGVVIEATASDGQKILDEALTVDGGARRLGEAAIGYNYSIRDHIKNMLFDEKIGGTIHFAIGGGIGEVGGTNESAIHWDMLCDMRNGGEYYADGELFYKDGEFIVQQ
ncbi:MAG: aminopeptidase [bacterium]|nr:aminopeptidase [bacterium]